jgi:hypothetical protein
MKDIKKAISPWYLPQMDGIPYKFITENLDGFGIEYRPEFIAVHQLKGSQKEVDLNKVESLRKVSSEKLPPIFVSENLYILDGHSRTASKKYEDKNAKIHTIRIGADEKDSATMLRIIQDRWEQKNKNI